MGRKGLLVDTDKTVLFDLNGGDQVLDVTEHHGGHGTIITVTLWPATRRNLRLFKGLLGLLREELPRERTV